MFYMIFLELVTHVTCFKSINIGVTVLFSINFGINKIHNIFIIINKINYIFIGFKFHLIIIKLPNNLKRNRRNK